MSRISRTGASASARLPVGGATPAVVRPAAAASAAAEAVAAADESAEVGVYVSVVEAPLRGMISLRADLSAPAVAAAVKAATGASAPAALRCWSDGEIGAYWMAPDELLLTTAYGAVQAAYDRAAATLSGVPHLLADVSDARQVIELSGPGAREVAAKGVSVDLDPGRFRVGDFRRTQLGGTAAALGLVGDDPDRFEIFCFRSYAFYVQRWLVASADAHAEIGLLRP